MKGMNLFMILARFIRSRKKAKRCFSRALPFSVGIGSTQVISFVLDEREVLICVVVLVPFFAMFATVAVGER